MENKEQEKYEEDDQLAFDSVRLENGDILDIYCDPVTDQVRRYYIKRGDETIEFGDPEKYQQISGEVIQSIKHHLAEYRMIVTDEEAEKIARAINDMEFTRGFDSARDMEQ